ncbi:unnamed protein product [Angiostrongylus costaricensis]|uniref:GPN-loop GTPase n=1 Tax=Angiostrongylus costaricensis TaxID=334426 RepID=A0A0R3PTW5_ANGCS|nr:unnamed protein product [Angiostrongylus costaricensis]
MSVGTESTLPKPHSQPDVSIPPSVLVLGMAGSGKTSFVQVPYPVNIDIRDTVKYKQVMKEYGLGPNGAIITSLNLMCTRFDQVLSMIRKRASQYSVCLLDTPGQIEAFTWSASGSIITDSLASSHPTLVAYVVDSARATNPTTFMSNMLYACSILYRTKLPFVVVFNKARFRFSFWLADIVSPAFARSWMNDFERFDQALEESRSSFMNDLSRSLSLTLDEFYSGLKTVSVSSLTGEGMEDFMKMVTECVEQYKTEYVPMYSRVLEEKMKLDQQEKRRKFEDITEGGLEVLSLHPSLEHPPDREQIHIGGVEEENAEDANTLR